MMVEGGKVRIKATACLKHHRRFSCPVEIEESPIAALEELERKDQSVGENGCVDLGVVSFFQTLLELNVST